MMFIIFSKELHSTPIQVTAVIILKPLAPLFSPYWSSWIEKRQDRLVFNIVWANILKYTPFLFSPWIENVWWFVFAFGFYMVFLRGVTPAWMEIIKLNVHGKAREQLISTGSTINYFGSAVFPFLFGWVLDDYLNAWRWLLFSTACIGILSIL